MNKQSFYLILIALGIIVLGFVAFMLFKPAKKTSNQPASSSSQEAQIQKISNEKMFFPSIDKSGNNILFFNTSGTRDIAFYKFSPDTNNSDRISPIMDVPENVIWSPTKDKVIIKIVYDKYKFEKFGSPFVDPSCEDGQEMTWVFDFNSQKFTQLNNNIQGINWFDEKIIYDLYDTTNDLSSIFIANNDGSNWKKINDIPFVEGVMLGKISADEIYYYPITFEFGGFNIYKVNIVTKQMSEIIQDNSAGGAIFNNKFLYNVIHNNYLTLGLMDKDGDNKLDLGIITSLDKTAFSENGDFIFAAFRANKETTDTIYKIDSKTGEMIKINYNFDTSIDAKNLMVLNNILYFTSDDYLFRLSLQ